MTPFQLQTTPEDLIFERSFVRHSFASGVGIVSLRVWISNAECLLAMTSARTRKSSEHVASERVPSTSTTMGSRSERIQHSRSTSDFQASLGERSETARDWESKGSGSRSVGPSALIVIAAPRIGVVGTECRLFAFFSRVSRANRVESP